MAGLSQNGACRSCQHQDDIRSTRPAPWKVEFRSSKGFVTWVVAIAVFTVCVLTIVVLKQLIGLVIDWRTHSYGA